MIELLYHELQRIEHHVRDPMLDLGACWAILQNCSQQWENDALDTLSPKFFTECHAACTHEPAAERGGRSDSWRKSRNAFGRTHSRRPVIEAESWNAQTRYGADIAYAA
jgi:hypothetical protein